MLLAIDPSVRSSGVALFHVLEGKLLAAGRVTTKNDGGDDESWRWLYMARTIQRWVDSMCAVGSLTGIVFERPQIYRASKSKGDPNDLIGLAGVAMAVVGLFSQSLLVDVASYTPAEWCGALPKATRGSAKASPRAKRILSRLSDRELALVPDQHDVIDAVGVGLHRLGRLEPIRVFSNGR